MGDGLVRRDMLERKTNGSLAPEAHLLIRKGDIAYNMMRMWQGASGLAERDGIVSPAYVVIAPKDGIDPLFASYWFKSARMIYLFWAYSYGITGDRLRLYYKDFARIPVTAPHRREQQRIGRVLATLDRVIDRLTQLIAAKRKLKAALAENLLTGKCRVPGFDLTWKTAELSEIASVTMGSSPPSFAYNDQCLGIPLIQGNADTRDRRSEPRMWTSVVTKTCSVGDVLMSVRAPVGEISISRHNACIGRGMCAIKANREFSHAYLHQAMRRLEDRWLRIGQGSTFTAINTKDVKGLSIDCPTELLEQERIATMLGTTDQEVVLLEKELAALRKLKKGLMQKLLTSPIQAEEIGNV